MAQEGHRTMLISFRFEWQLLAIKGRPTTAIRIEHFSLSIYHEIRKI